MNLLVTGGCGFIEERFRDRSKEGSERIKFARNPAYPLIRNGDEASTDGFNYFGQDATCLVGYDDTTVLLL
jgi:hypothetical protein